jgi:hypothetical protein
MARTGIPVVVFVACAMLGCSRAPTEQEIAARKAREEAIVNASVEEERQKDRTRAAAAAREAEEKTDAMRRSAAPPAEEPSTPRTITMLSPVAPVATTSEEVIAQATARVEMALANPASMLVRSPQLREQNTIVCLEVNSRDATGGYTGFVPVIVTPTKVHIQKGIRESRDVSEVSATLEFNRLNERLRCW